MTPPVRVLITGAGGFIGSALVRHLVTRGREVHALHRPGRLPGRLTALQSRISLHAVDMRDQHALEALCAEVAPHEVFHLAGNTDVRFLDEQLSTLSASLTDNVMPSIGLLQALRPVRAVQTVVRVGGLEEYGNGPAPYRETQREAPVSPYSASQVAVTHYWQMLQPVLPFAVATARPALVYGPGQSSRFLIPALIEAGLAGGSFSLSRGDQRRDLIYLDDVVAGLCALAAHPDRRGAVVNLGGGGAHAVREVAERIVALTGRRLRLQIGAQAARRSEIQHLEASVERAQTWLGWVPQIDLHEGLARTVAWHRAQRADEGDDAI